jgi:hypothetical protein
MSDQRTGIRAVQIRDCASLHPRYRDDHGGPGTLHQRLVTDLGQWLDAQEVRWSWRNHSDGILHDHHDGLAGLALLDE